MALESDAREATLRASIWLSALAIFLVLALAYVVRRDSSRLRLSEERLATTMRSIGDAVIATDEHGAVTMINPVAEKLTGWQLAQARGKPLEEVFRIVNEQTRVTVESPVTKVLREGGIVGLANHTVLIHKAGHETAIEDSGAPICDDAGVVTGVVLVFRDATEERAAKNALQLADRRKDEFLATLAHELRNPLAPIRQAAAVAAHAGTTPEQIRWSHAVIERQTAHMARLLDDLLDVSRITRGRLEVRRTRVALRSVVDAAVETARPAIDAGKHTLKVSLPDQPLMLDADAMRISQVLANLLTNAAKYTEHPGTHSTGRRTRRRRRRHPRRRRRHRSGAGRSAQDLRDVCPGEAHARPQGSRARYWSGALQGARRAARRHARGQAAKVSARAVNSPYACNWHRRSRHRHPRR